MKIQKKSKILIIFGIVLIASIPVVLLILPPNFINFGDMIEIQPTPTSNIELTYSIQETQNQEIFYYQFDLNFSILDGIDQNFTSSGELFTNSSLFLTIKANSNTDLYTVIEIFNISKFQNNFSRYDYQKILTSPTKFESIEFRLHHAHSADRINGGLLKIKGSYLLFNKENPISVKNIENFSSNSYIWINENYYQLSFEIFPENVMKYSLNSSVLNDHMFIDIAQLTILRRDDLHRTQIGAIALPLLSGTYISQNNSLIFSEGYDFLSFDFVFGISSIFTEWVRYDIN